MLNDQIFSFKYSQEIIVSIIANSLEKKSGLVSIIDSIPTQLF